MKVRTKVKFTLGGSIFVPEGGIFAFVRTFVRRYVRKSPHFDFVVYFSKILP